MGFIIIVLFALLFAMPNARAAAAASTAHG